jgi:putative NIF3 family GTP cyclohydrolase 1 type 2
VYAPHTALDSVWGGINDWLASAFSAPGEPEAAVRLLDPKSAVDDLGGLGRIAELPHPLPVSELHQRIRKHLGLAPGALQVAYGSSERADRLVRSVAICAGGGGSVLKGVNADMYWTGEMLHVSELLALA